MKMASKGSPIDWSSWMLSARTGTRCSPQVPESRRPTFFMASTCSGHWSISVTSCPAFVSMPPTMPPIAPAPRMPMRVLMRLCPLLLEGGHDLGGESLQLLEDHGLRRAHDLTDVHDLETRILVLNLHELLGDELGRPDQPGAGLHGVAQGRRVAAAG